MISEKKRAAQGKSSALFRLVGVCAKLDTHAISEMGQAEVARDRQVHGNASRNMLRGPAFKDVNVVSLNAPSGNGATVGSSTFGEITSASAMRQLQLGLRSTF
jgi:hypothetical protein